jgi:pantoate--beta-alanine ligase
MVDVVADPEAVRERVRAWRCAGDSVALVPTMGDLHAAHLRLVEAASAQADRVLVSIFVNPLQFGPGDDYASYPRAIERDRRNLAEYGVDGVYAPEPERVYPRGLAETVRIHVPGLEEILCGDDRPGHFAGVATVVAKLLNTAEPDLAVFGEKDYQQLLLVQRLAADLDFGVDIVGVPTVRESDGLALSSRNGYLGERERAIAGELYSTLRRISQRLLAGERAFERLQADAVEALTQAGFTPVYVAVRRAHDLGEPDRETPALALRVLAAAHLGPARLIDNIAGDEAEEAG